MKTNTRYLAFATTLGIFFFVASAFAYVTIAPRESSTGGSETYTMRVPTERDSATVRIEAEFSYGHDGLRLRVQNRLDNRTDNKRCGRSCQRSVERWIDRSRPG